MEEKTLVFEQKKITLSTLLLIVTLLASNVLGMIRDRVLVTLFETRMLDTYYAAFRIPDLIFNLLILGALSAAIIPTFTSYLVRKEKEEAWYIINSVTSLGLLVTLSIIIVLGFFVPTLLKIIAPGFDSERLKITAGLTRMMLISPIFFGLSGIFSSVLHSFKKFFINSLSPILYNLGIIFGAILFTPYWGIYGLAWGVILGAFLHMTIQLPSLFKLGFRFRLVFDLYHRGVRKIGRLMISPALSSGLSQAVPLINTALGSLIGASSVAIINLANNIQTLPLVVFGISFSTTIFPNLAEKAALSKEKSFISHLSWGIRQILFLIIPAALGLILLRAQIVRLILGSYKFSWSDTMLTAACLGVFSFSLFAQSLIPLLSRAFYALHDTKTPLFITAISVVLNGSLAFFLTRVFLNPTYQIIAKSQVDGRVIGLALAFSLASFFNLALSFFYLRQKLSHFETIRILTSLAKIVLASLVMGVTVYGTLHLVALFVNTRTGLGLLIQTLAAILVGLIVYFKAASLLRCEEIKTVKDILQKRFIR